MQQQQECSNELYSLILNSLNETRTKYIDTDVYCVHINVNDTLEIKEFLVKRVYRGQGYGLSLARKLQQSPMNITIVSCLSPKLQRILKYTGWRTDDSFDYTNH